MKKKDEDENEHIPFETNQNKKNKGIKSTIQF